MAQEDRGPAPVPPPPLLDVRDLSVVARQRKQDALPIVADVSFELRPGEVIPLIGESGSGKTTLGRVIAGLLPARSGEVSFEGRSLGTSVGAQPGGAPRQLSGGERQRVNLARALAAEPRLIVCDEITSALDRVVAQAILDLLRDLQERLDVGYLFISHDISTIARIADTIAVMQEGAIVEAGRTEDVLTPPHHPYTELLLSSVPDMRTDWLDTLALPPRA